MGGESCPRGAPACPRRALVSSPPRAEEEQLLSSRFQASCGLKERPRFSVFLAPKLRCVGPGEGLSRGAGSARGARSLHGVRLRPPAETWSLWSGLRGHTASSQPVGSGPGSSHRESPPHPHPRWPEEPTRGTRPAPLIDSQGQRPLV